MCENDIIVYIGTVRYAENMKSYINKGTNSKNGITTICRIHKYLKSLGFKVQNSIKVYYIVVEKSEKIK